MAISQRNFNNWSIRTGSGSLSPPPSLVAGDRKFLFAAWKPYTVTLSVDQGWTQIVEFADGTVADGNGTGSVKVAVWYKDHIVSDPDPTLTFSNTISVAAVTMVVFQKDSGEFWIDPRVATAAIAANTNWTATASSNPLITAGELALGIVGFRDDSATMTRSTTTGLAATGVTWADNYTEYPATHASNTTSTDISADAGYRIASSGTSSAAPTMAGTLSASETGTAVWVIQGVTNVQTLSRFAQAQALIKVTGRGFAQATAEINANNSLKIRKMYLATTSSSTNSLTVPVWPPHRDSALVLLFSADILTGGVTVQGAGFTWTQLDEIIEGNVSASVWAQTTTVAADSPVVIEWTGSPTEIGVQIYEITNANKKSLRANTSSGTVTTDPQTLEIIESANGNSIHRPTFTAWNWIIDLSADFQDLLIGTYLGQLVYNQVTSTGAYYIAANGELFSSNQIDAIFSIPPVDWAGASIVVEQRPMAFAGAQALITTTKTHIFMTNTASDINPGANIEKEASFSRGSSIVNAVLNTPTGPNSGLTWTNTAGGTNIEWFTPPLNAVTISGDILYNAWVAESDAAANATTRFLIERVSNTGTFISTISASKYGPEMSTTKAQQAWTATPTSTTLNAGDRIRIRVQISDATSVTLASGHTTTLGYAGPNFGADGDTWVLFDETISPFIVAATSVFGQAQARIKQTYFAFGQANAQIIKPIAGIIAYDTFTDTDGKFLVNHVSDSGHLWTEIHEPDPQILSNHYDPNGQNGSNARIGGNLAADVDVRMTVNLGADGVSRGNAIRFRYSSNDDFLFLKIRRSSTPVNQLQIWRRVGGVTDGSPLASTTLGAGILAANTEYELKVIAVGSDIRGYIDGIEYITLTSSFNQTAQGVVATFEETVSTGQYVDNIYVRLGVAAATQFGQAQAQIKQVYMQHAQAQARIKQVYQNYAQSQASIKQVYQNFAQVNAYIKTVNVTQFGSTQARIGTGALVWLKDTFTRSSTTVLGQPDIGSYYNSQVPLTGFEIDGNRLKLTVSDDDYKAVETSSRNGTYNLDFSAEFEVPSPVGGNISYITAYLNARIEDIEASPYVGVDLIGGNLHLVVGSNTESTAIPFSYDTVYCLKLRVFNNTQYGKVWKKSDPEPDWQRTFDASSYTKAGLYYYFEIGNDTATNPVMYIDNIQASEILDIKHAQTQALIVVTNIESFAQTQTWIKVTDVEAFGQVQAQIKQVYQSYGQTQAQIRKNYEQFAQSQAQIKQTYQSFGQAQGSIKQVYNQFAQTQAQIKQSYQQYAQSQALIKQTYYGFGQTQVWIEAVEESFGQAQARILTNYQGYGQANAKINAFNVQAYGQALSNIKGEDVEGVGQAQAYIKGIDVNRFGQSQASVLTNYQQYGQAQASIKTTYSAFGQAQADILQIYFGYAQSNAYIIVIHQDFGQVQARILATYNQFAQSQAYILLIREAFGQAQASIETTYNQHAQAQGQIIQSYQQFGQAQANIKTTYLQFAQAQANIKATYNSHAQAEALIKQTYFSFAQAQAQIKQNYQSYGQAQANILATYNTFGQAQGSIKTAYNQFGQANADILQTYIVHAQSQAVIKVIDIEAFGQSQAQIQQIYQGYAQAQATIQGNVYGQAQAQIKQSYQAYGNAQAQIKQVYFGFGQTQTRIEQTYQEFAQAQSSILTNYQQHAQAQGTIKQSYQVYGQANAYIKVEAVQAYANAQADILQVYQSYAQSNARIISFGVQGYGQAQGNIRAEGNFAFSQAQAKINAFDYPQFAQSQAWIETTINNFGQSQGSVKAVSSAHGQAEAWIEQTYNQFAQAQATILTTYNVYAQANAYIILSGLNQHGQAQGIIRVTTVNTGQANALIVRTENSHAQSQAQIKQTYNQYGQAQAQVKTTYSQFGQAQGIIRTTAQQYGQANAQIKGIGVNTFGQAEAYIRFVGTVGHGQAAAQIKAINSNQFGQVQGQIKQTYLTFGQTQSQIRQTYFGFAQANTYIYLVKQEYGQAAASIKTTYTATGQAQALIRTTVNRFANAQSSIKVTVNNHGQVQGLIVTSYQAYGQAQALITSGNLKFAQARAIILVTDNTSFGQAQAFMIKAAGYGQARAFIHQPHELKSVDTDDYNVISTKLDDKLDSLSLTLSDEGSIVRIDDMKEIKLIIDDTP